MAQTDTRYHYKGLCGHMEGKNEAQEQVEPFSSSLFKPVWEAFCQTGEAFCLGWLVAR